MLTPLSMCWLDFLSTSKAAWSTCDGNLAQDQSDSVTCHHSSIMSHLSLHKWDPGMSDALSLSALAAGVFSKQLSSCGMASGQDWSPSFLMHKEHGCIMTMKAHRLLRSAGGLPRWCSVASSTANHLPQTKIGISVFIHLVNICWARTLGYVPV